ncbi:LssY C-terminal domain-containing protein [Paraherbaspirillum soli]|uniref:LssY C-terminal domain-containing protein n=1 Tax=Paraherbaspirillum soli TaxID=631222 RepID=A0ABW0MD86_9BURK
MGSHLQTLIGYFAAHPMIALGAVFAASLLEALAVIGTIVPGSSIVFIGGALLGLNALNPWWTVAAAVSGAILGDGISYWLGHHYREHIPTIWPMKNYPGLLNRGQAYFFKHGGKSVFFGRFLAPVRAIVPVVAGMSGMPALPFYVMNSLSAVAWAAIHLIPGALFGASLQLAGAVSSRLVVVLLVLALVLWGAGKLVRIAYRAYQQLRPHIKWLREHTARRLRGKPGLLLRIALLALVITLGLVAGLYVGDLLSADGERYAHHPVAASMPLADWGGGGWRLLPRARSELDGDLEEPFSLQWVGSAAQIGATLSAAGWQHAESWSSKTMLLWLLADTPIQQLPVLPKYDRGRVQKITYVKVLNPRQRLVIRLWPMRYKVETVSGEPPSRLWSGMVTLERLQHPIGMITLARTASDFNAPLPLLEQDLQSQRLSVQRRQRHDTGVLLVR